MKKIFNSENYLHLSTVLVSNSSYLKYFLIVFEVSQQVSRPLQKLQPTFDYLMGALQVETTHWKNLWPEHVSTNSSKQRQQLHTTKCSVLAGLHLELNSGG